MSSRTYPAWFYRVRSLVQDRKARGQAFRYYDDELPTRPQDYDEDLSECPNDGEDSDQSSTLSEISGNASSEKVQYYAMKEQRNERKKQLRDRRTGQGSNQSDDEWSEETQVQKELEIEEEEIRPIKEALTKAQQSPEENSAPLKKLAGRLFRLWSTDHVKYCTFETAPRRYIEFYDPKEFRGFKTYPDGKIDGHIYMVADDMCEIDIFTPPKNSSLDFVRLDGNRGRHYFELQFFDNHHLTLKMPKDLVFYRQAISPPSEAPEVFTYYGICEKYEYKLYRAKQRKEAQGK